MMREGHDPRSSTHLASGTRLANRYLVGGPIGRGGMATAYAACDERLQRAVCIKLLRSALPTTADAAGEPEGATYAHFVHEAYALARLSHPNTLRIYDFAHLPDGRPFQVSELLDAGSLEGHVRTTGRLSPRTALETLRAIVGAVSEAHHLGIVHRDIKPSNILFARFGTKLVPKLADFGIARNIAASTKAREGDVFLFSPRWAAPEQLTGCDDDSPATDIHGLALVVHFMLTGRPLFDDEEIERTFRARVTDRYFLRERIEASTRDLAIDAGALEGLRVVLRNALEIDPTKRTSSAALFFRAVADALSSPRALLRDDTTGAESGVIRIAPSGVAPGDPTCVVVPIPTSTQTITIDRHAVELVSVDDRFDLALGSARLRLTILPEGAGLQVKGLSCFVAQQRSGRPTSAITASRDGATSLLSSTRQIVGKLSWSFGRRTKSGRVFRIDDADVLVPFERARDIVMLRMDPHDRILVLCRNESKRHNVASTGIGVGIAGAARS